MRNLLYLVQGTPLSKEAAQISILTARTLKADISALFIVDRDEILALEGFGGPALCGSGVFIHAYQEIAHSLTDLGESLLMSFGALAEGHSIKVLTQIECGKMTNELAVKSRLADLIIAAGSAQNIALIQQLCNGSLPPVILVLSSKECLILQHRSTDSDQIEELSECFMAAGIKTSVVQRNQTDKQCERPQAHAQILLVDHNPSICKLLASELEVYGVDCDIRTDITEALDVALARRYRLILVNADDSDGTTLLKFHRDEDERNLSRTPIVGLSDHVPCKSSAGEIEHVYPRAISTNELDNIIHRWLPEKRLLTA